MSSDIFIARAEEQEKFKQILNSYRKGWMRRNFPTFSKIFSSKSKAFQPRILLFYGDSGMGKSMLAKRLCEIITDDSRFKDSFNHLFIDWDVERNKPNSKLAKDHDSIHPESVLSILYDKVTSKNRVWKSYFSEYRQVQKELDSLERKVSQELRSKPDEELNKKLSKIGSKGITWLFRHYSNVNLDQEVVEQTLDLTIQGGSEIIRNARKFMQKTLDSREYEIYEHPHEKLSEALGVGFSAMSDSIPLIVVMDTYEIVDRKECDYTLRNIIKNSGDSVIWIIIGRSNLAATKRLLTDNFKGYRLEFSELVYAKRLSEFGKTEIVRFFSEKCPERPISEDEALEIGKFSLGIPFVIAQAAEIWRRGVRLEEITSPILRELDGTSFHEKVIMTTTERFMKYCFNEEDVRTIYALGLLRSYPKVELLEQILGTKSLEQKLRKIWEKYSFISIEKVGLEEKFARFLRDYMLLPLRKSSFDIQNPNSKAIEFLEERYERIKRDDGRDTYEKMNDDYCLNITYDCLYHKFWRSVDEGWEFLVLVFVESWQYNLEAAQALLEICKVFHRTFSSNADKMKLFKLMRRVVDPVFGNSSSESHDLLEELEKLSGYGFFDKDIGSERMAILCVQKGCTAYRRGNYKEALGCYQEACRFAPDNATHLKLTVADNFFDLSVVLIWVDGSSRKIVYSSDGEQAIRAAISLSPNKAAYQYCLGVILQEQSRFDEAISVFERAIEIDPEYAKPYCMLGVIHRKKSNLKQAELYFRRAMEIDKKSPHPYIHLGFFLNNLKGDWKGARNLLTQGLDWCENEQKATIHYLLGNIHRDQKEYLAAEEEYRKAVKLDARYAVAMNALGWLYLLRKEYLTAQEKIEQAINLDPKESSYYFNLGVALAMQEKLDEARDAWKQGLMLCEGEYGWQQVTRVFYRIAIGEVRVGLNDLQEFIRDGHEIGGLKNVFGDAQILVDCPIKINGIDRAFELLNAFHHKRR